MDWAATIEGLIEKAGKFALPIFIAGAGMLLLRRNDIWPGTETPPQEAAWLVIATAISGAVVLVQVLALSWTFLGRLGGSLARPIRARQRRRSVMSRFGELNAEETTALFWMLRHNYNRVEAHAYKQPFSGLIRKGFLEESDPHAGAAPQFLNLNSIILRSREDVLEGPLHPAIDAQTGDPKRPPWVPERNALSWMAR